MVENFGCNMGVDLSLKIDSYQKQLVIDFNLYDQNYEFQPNIDYVKIKKFFLINSFGEVTTLIILVIDLYDAFLLKKIS